MEMSEQVELLDAARRYLNSADVCVAIASGDHPGVTPKNTNETNRYLKQAELWKDLGFLAIAIGYALPKVGPPGEEEKR